MEKGRREKWGQGGRGGKAKISRWPDKGEKLREYMEKIVVQVLHQRGGR